MGAGEYEMGDGGAGEDPVATSTAPATHTLPEAAQYDGASKDFLLDDDGRYLPTTSATQGAMLSVVAYRLKQLRAIRPVPGPGLQKQVEDQVNQALADRVRAGQIRIDKVTANTSGNAAIVVLVDFTDLAANAADQAQVVIRG